MAGNPSAAADFCNKICQKATFHISDASPNSAAGYAKFRNFQAEYDR
jgi:hypothetical protein